jgi:hypothetical protein
VVPSIPVAALPDTPRGYGLLAEVEGVPVRAAARRSQEPRLPPLRVRTAAGQDERAAPRDGPDVDPQHRAIADEPVPVKKRSRARQKIDGGDDEDLLP